MNIKNSIAIIIPYFGKWPQWIDLFLFSCEQNRGIDFVFFTDCDISLSDAINIKFNSMSFPDYCTLVSKSLKIDFQPKSPYKLCDLKPFYGYIHKDILKKYDFWGFGDIDVVWGDIRSFYTEDLLNSYDIFSTHNDRISGHLCLFRNNEKYSDLCFKIKDWSTKLCKEEYLSLDESHISVAIFPVLKYLWKFYSHFLEKIFGWKLAWEIYYTLFPIIHFLSGFKYKKLFFKEQHTTPILSSDGSRYKYESDSWVYKNEKISNDRVNKDYIYLHFMILKKNSFRDDYYWKGHFYNIKKEDIKKGVLINTKGFFSLNT